MQALASKVVQFRHRYFKDSKKSSADKCNQIKSTCKAKEKRGLIEETAPACVHRQREVWCDQTPDPQQHRHFSREKRRAMQEVAHWIRTQSLQGVSWDDQQADSGLTVTQHHHYHHIFHHYVT